jgi:hypothetical protein
VRYEAALALHALGDSSGVSTMATDKSSSNESQAVRAKKAYDTITGAGN